LKHSDYDSKSLSFFLVRTFVETESKLSSVERLSFFYRGIPTEPATTATAPAHLPKDWPTAGKVSVKKVLMSFVLEATLFSLRNRLMTDERVIFDWRKERDQQLELRHRRRREGWRSGPHWRWQGECHFAIL